jgi:hypothetical protein
LTEEYERLHDSQSRGVMSSVRFRCGDRPRNGSCFFRAAVGPPYARCSDLARPRLAGKATFSIQLMVAFSAIVGCQNALLPNWKSSIRLTRLTGDDYPRISRPFVTDWYYYAFSKLNRLSKEGKLCV